MKVIDITEKLNFEEKPKIRIKDTEITINNSATTVLKLLSVLNKGEMSPENVMNAIDLLITPEEMEKLEKLDLSFKDFMTFITSAVGLITGDDGEGEALTCTTT